MPNSNEHRQPTLEELEQTGRKLVPFKFFARPGDKCVAQLTGEPSGLITLDFDMEAGSRLYGQLGVQAHRRTPHGWHIDVKHPGMRSIGRAILGLDILGNGRMAVVTGTKGGLPYTWLRDPRPYEISELSPVLQDLLLSVEGPRP